MISNDDPAPLTRFARNRKIAFTLLSDKSAAMIEGFDAVDHSVPKSAIWYGIARHMIFVINPDGIITHRFSYADSQVREDPSEVLNALH